MLDFLMITTRTNKRGGIEIYPRFRLYPKSSDLMIRGGDFYAVWLEDKGLWSTEESDVLELIDRELDQFAKENKEKFEGHIKVLHMWDSESGMVDAWHKYCQKQMRDSFNTLDEKLIFSDTETSKKDYASKRLNYPLVPCETPGYNTLMETLYTPEERHKIEWAIGCIVAGDSKTIQKFMVLYGAAGTGKSTILNVIQKLFAGYYSVFDAKALGSSSQSFALEAFKSNPLVAIQHDGDLSKIEDNTRLNSLVSHEMMTVNEKFKSTYSNSFKCFLFMGTNKPVKITDGKSGLIRRLIDVSPSGNKLSAKDYKKATKLIDFELGGIAHHCLDVYKEDPGAYDDYMPIAMMGASNDFYNFIVDSFHIFKKGDGTSLKAAWEMYNTYCDEAKITYPLSKMKFKEELKNYFWDFKERVIAEDGSRIRSYYSGFRTDKFEHEEDDNDKKVEEVVSEKTVQEVSQSDNTGETKETGGLVERTWLSFSKAGNEFKSMFDSVCESCSAQYASAKETPRKAWADVRTTLRELDTKRLHYVKVPINHIVIDFDIKGPDGNKSFELNLEAASKWPATYAELSKSGAGIHLHYIYTGDPLKLSAIYDDDIEIKVFKGLMSLRRKLTKCNDLPIAEISSGLPLRGDNKLINFDSLKNEKAIRTLIKRNLNKEYHSSTRCSIDFIYKILEDAYDSGMKYDVSVLENEVYAFAAQSTNQSSYCISKVSDMKFKSEDPSDFVENEEMPIVFYDCEVFPNLFLINWKFEGDDAKVVRMINPTPQDIEKLIQYRLVGFNCRRYDNHILYGCLIGYSNEQIYNLSQRIISGDSKAMFGEAYNLSYTDVYDYAAKKQSLKKWEIELGIHHQELGLPWDKPVDESLWDKVAEYCDNDVIATEAVWNKTQGDFTARGILAKLAGGSVNDTTNSLTTKIIFGRERKPKLVYTHLEETFPGYEFDQGKNMYRGDDLGYGGYVYAEPGMYGNVALLDIASLHPHSVIAMNCFGDYTQNFKDILDARIFIKHKDFDSARHMLDGKLAPYLDDEDMAGDLAQALKIAINSVYGLTSASFPNPFRDERNVNNIVALRGALFMRTLQDEVQARGYTVVHIKTDSIKIADATPDIIAFCMDFAKKYKYTFEHEATYDRMCLMNNAVYVAKYATVEKCEELYGADYVASGKDVVKENKKHPNAWTATGTQFKIPYVFKKMFSHEPIEFADMCETKEVKTAIYLDMNENLPDVTADEKMMAKFIKGLPTLEATRDISDEMERLTTQIATGHDYHFVGKVGLFCPIKPGCGGGLLVREAKDKNGNIKYDSVTGASDYRWLESEMVSTLGKEDDIDLTYYNALIDAAIFGSGRKGKADYKPGINDFGDYEWFVSDDPYIPEKKMNTPPWLMVCGRETCEGCPNLKTDKYDMECALGHDIGDFAVFNKR